MKKIIFLIILVSVAALAFAAAPVVTNVLSSPGIGLVTISYDLVADGNCDVRVIVSANDGGRFDIYPTALSGDVGNSVPNIPTAKTIIWHSAADGIALGNQYKVKVIARDNPAEGPAQVQSLVLVEGGTFNNGISNVTVSSFYMDKYEVTQGDYEAVMGYNPATGTSIGSDYPAFDMTWYAAIAYSNLRSMQEGLTPCYSYTDGIGYGTNPASWPAGWDSGDDTHYNVACSWTANGYRLPTEAEWEFAARGGNLTHNYLYSGSNDIIPVAWFTSNSGYVSHKVGLKAANELGLYDMSGNIREWNWDILESPYPSGSQTNPTGAISGISRVGRGGHYGDSYDRCYVSSRTGTRPRYDFKDVGFRIVRIAP